MVNLAVSLGIVSLLCSVATAICDQLQLIGYRLAVAGYCTSMVMVIVGLFLLWRA